MMPGKTDKQKEAEQDSGDEMQPGRQNKIWSTSSGTVNFATSIQANSFDKDQQPNSTLETEPTQFPTALLLRERRERSQAPPPEASRQPDEKSFTTEQVDDLSNTATIALQTPETFEIEQLKHELASAREQLELSQNENGNLRQRQQTLENVCRSMARQKWENRDQSSHASCALRSANRSNNYLRVELGATLQYNEVLEDMLKDANAKADELQNELAIVMAEKSELEKKIPKEQKVWRRSGSGKRMESFYE